MRLPVRKKPVVVPPPAGFTDIPPPPPVVVHVHVSGTLLSERAVRDAFAREARNARRWPGSIA